MSKYPYLPLKFVNQLEIFAEHYGVSKKARGLEKPTWSDKGFLEVYRDIKGNDKKLSKIPCRKDKPEGVTWDKKRESQVKAKLGQIKKMKLPLFDKDGIPTIIHTNLLMWAYSPQPDKLKKSLKIFHQLYKK
jgi:hypothetical protein